MVDSLTGPKLKIERANTHIHDLVERDNAFFHGPDGDPYVVTREVYLQDTSQECLKLTMTKEMSGEIPIIVGEVIHNLRSSLDHLAVLLAKINGAQNTRHTYFPIGRDKTHFELPETQKK